MTDHSLPAGFESLQPFVKQWAVETTHERDYCRSISSAEDRLAFFNTASDLLDPALCLLDKKPFAAMTVEERTLLNLMLSFAHVAMAVEIHGADEPSHARWRSRMKITRSSADE